MSLKNVKNKLLFILFLLSVLINPICTYAYSSSVIVGGENIGIEVKSKGILIVGFYDINGSSPGENAGLKVGDVITKIDDTAIYKIADLSKLVSDSKTNIKITYLRNNKSYDTNIELIKDSNNVFKTGLYVKDSIVGIGTLTFIDPKSMQFGALGHEITEKSTGKKFEINNGTIFKSVVTNIDKSTRNNPGEKNAKYFSDDVYGTIDKNSINGIYGLYTKDIDNNRLKEVGKPSEIKLGKATIRTVVSGTEISEYEINIVKLFFDNKTKNILFEVTDQNLLTKSNGIVQGMSGSPILQDDKIIGAVTHVVVDNPKKGYGIFITNMLEEADKR